MKESLDKGYKTGLEQKWVWAKVELNSLFFVLSIVRVVCFIIINNVVQYKTGLTRSDKPQKMWLI